MAVFLFPSSTVWKIKCVFFCRDCPKLLLFPMSHVIPDSMIQKSNRHIWIFDTERLDCLCEHLLCLFYRIIPSRVFFQKTENMSIRFGLRLVSGQHKEISGRQPTLLPGNFAKLSFSLFRQSPFGKISQRFYPVVLQDLCKAQGCICF